MLSTVSGGTFPGALYVSYLIEKSEAEKAKIEEPKFEDFFKKTYVALSETQFVKKVLEKLEEEEKTDTPKPRKLITHAAQIYAETTFIDKEERPVRFGCILDANDIHLEEIIFNTTEFHHGIDFRFQKSTRNSDAKIGNFYMFIPRDLARHIRLADIVAASSCIPAGFAPILFPDEFDWAGDTNVLQHVKDVVCTIKNEDTKPFEEPVPIMDGGVYDNLGVDGLLTADKRKPEGYQPKDDDEEDFRELDLIIISDVYKDKKPHHKYPKEIDLGFLGQRTIGKIAKYAKILFWLLVIFSTFTLVLGVVITPKFQHKIFSILYLMPPLMLALFTGGGLLLGRYFFNKFLKKKDVKKNYMKFLKENFPRTEEARFGKVIKQLTANRVASMIWRRALSLVDLTAAVFMFRIRQLVKDDIYSQEYYRDKSVHVAIYDLIEKSIRDSQLLESWDIQKPEPNGKLMNVIENAAAMETEMWFDSDHPIHCPVTSGQATLCYNLMKHIHDSYKEYEENAFPENIKPLWETLKKDWKEFVKNPYWLLEKLNPEEEFSECDPQRVDNL
jgi:hypothetical protein